MMESVLAQFKERFAKRHEYCRGLKKSGKKLMACFYGLVPKELIHAAGLVPVQLIEDRSPRYEEQSGLLPYLCGMSKNLTGQIYSGVLDYIEGIMVATVCDTNRRVFDVWVHKKIFPHLLLARLPATTTELAVQYYKNELRRLAGELRRISGVKVTEERLWQSIAAFNENRELFQQFYGILPQTEISGEEAIWVFASALVAPVEEHNELLKKLLASSLPPLKTIGRVELMLCALNLNMSMEVSKLAEKYGGRMVTNDFTHNARYGSDLVAMGGDPFESLARGYLGRIPAPGVYPFEKRALSIRERMERAGARGMIFLIQQYCDAYAMEYAILKERFDRWNLRHLKLEAEDTPSSIEQLNVRVQSFVESLL